MANQAGRDSTALPFVRNNGAGGYRTPRNLKAAAVQCMEYPSEKFPFGLTRLSSRPGARARRQTERAYGSLSFVAFFGSRARAEAAAGAFSRLHPAGGRVKV